MTQRSRSARLLILGLTIAATVPFAAGQSQAGSYSRVVTFGDSYSSGVGIWDNNWQYDDQGPGTNRYGNIECWREDDTTPGNRLALSQGAARTMMACSGAQVATISNQIADTTFSNQGAGTLVVMTAGGNDLRTSDGRSWPKLLAECITTYLNCHLPSWNQLTNFSFVQADLTAMYTTLGNKARNAKIRVFAYPRIMQPDSFWGCPGVTGINSNEARWMDQQVDRLNSAVSGAVAAARAATGADIQVMSVLSQFAGHGSCRRWASDRYINDRQGSLSNPSDASFHPNQNGYNAFYNAMIAAGV